MRKSSKTALGGIIAALSLTLMLLSTVIPFLTYVLPAMAGIILMIMVIEIGRKWALVAYAAVSILSLLILADKETALMYVAFFGYYPIAKSVIEEKLPAVWEYIVKFLLFNVAVVTAYVLILYVFRLPVGGLDTFGKWTIPLLLLMANVMFFLFDYTLSKLVSIYMSVWRKWFRKIFK